MTSSRPPLLTPAARSLIRPGIDGLEASLIGEVSALGFGDPEVVPLWFGEGDEVTPKFVADAAIKALQAGETFYTFKHGIPPLRAALAAYETRLHAKPVTDERVVVTSSGMQGIMLITQTLIDAGDNMLILSPVWPNIRAAVEILGGEARQVALGATNDGGFRLDVEALEAAIDNRTKAVFINSPSNPTGWVASPAELAALLDFTRRHGIYLISDEVYARIYYDAPAAPSLLDFAEPDDRVVVINSFSKAWAMTGWRLGWMVLPAGLTATIGKLVEFNSSGSPTFLQYAALAAIEEGEEFIARMNKVYRAGRDLSYERLSRLPRVRLRRPDGAFYAFMQIDGLTDSVAFAKEILARVKVGLAPGRAFGLGGEGHLRLCFAASQERLNMAFDRLETILT